MNRKFESVRERDQREAYNKVAQRLLQAGFSQESTVSITKAVMEEMMPLFINPPLEIMRELKSFFDRYKRSAQQLVDSL